MNSDRAREIAEMIANAGSCAHKSLTSLPMEGGRDSLVWLVEHALVVRCWKCRYWWWLYEPWRAEQRRSCPFCRAHCWRLPGAGSPQTHRLKAEAIQALRRETRHTKEEIELRRVGLDVYCKDPSYELLTRQMEIMGHCGEDGGDGLDMDPSATDTDREGRHAEAYGKLAGGKQDPASPMFDRRRDPISDAVLTLRTRLRDSRERFAKRLKVTRVTVYNLERGEGKSGQRPTLGRPQLYWAMARIAVEHGWNDLETVLHDAARMKRARRKQ